MSGRFQPLDRLRALAVVCMVQGHTFTALLAPDALPPSLLHLHAAVHGLTAPTFLFGAGLAFGVSTYPRYGEHHRSLGLLRSRLGRYALLLAVGYGLQLPGASLLAALRLSSAELAPVLRVGPLHLIAFCMTFCQLTVLAVRSPRVHARIMLAVATLIAALSPQVYASQVASALGPLLGPWLDASYGSLFPLFPWASFALLGVAASSLLTLRAARPPPARTWLVAGILLSGTSYALFRLGIRLCEPPWFWHASPLHVAFRVGLVCCLLAALHPWRPSPPETNTQSATLARHSLVAYVTHLLLLYGTPFTPNIAHRYAQQLTFVEASAVFGIIMLLTLLSARAFAAMPRTPARGWVHAALSLLGLLVLLR